MVGHIKIIEHLFYQGSYSLNKKKRQNTIQTKHPLKYPESHNNIFQSDSLTQKTSPTKPTQKCVHFLQTKKPLPTYKPARETHFFS